MRSPSGMNSRLPEVALVVFDQFSPFHLSVPSLIFSDDFLDRPRFTVRLVAGESGPITSDIGMYIKPHAGLEGLEKADVIIVPYWRSPDEVPGPELLAALAQAHQRGATLIGLCLGGYVLAYSGVLNGRQAAMHWEFEDDFAARFPAIRLESNALYIEDHGVITSAGVAANIDCCLHLFQTYYGTKAANAVARRMVISPYREGGRTQVVEKSLPETTADARINNLLEQMRQRLSDKHRVDALASSVMMTRRTFTRKFQQATGMPVSQWLTSERLNRARELLESTRLSVDSIAEETGFASEAALRGQFKKHYDLTPLGWRKRNGKG